MNKTGVTKIASLLSAFFTLMLFIGANSNSSFMMHQEAAPEGIERFRVI